MRKPLTIAAISAALVVTPLALTTPAYAGSALPSLKQLKVSGSWTEPSATQLGNPSGGIPSLCPMGQTCSVRMWADLAGEIPSYALVAAGRATSKAAARALAAQLMQAENVTAAEIGSFVWSKQRIKKNSSMRGMKIWTGKLTVHGIAVEQATVVVSGAKIATFYTYGISVSNKSKPKKAIAALAKVVAGKKKLTTLSGTPRGFIGALNDNLSETG